MSVVADLQAVEAALRQQAQALAIHADNVAQVMVDLLAIDSQFDLIVDVIEEEPSTSDGDYFVSVDGDDGSPGIESEPWRTIQKAIDTISAGDTVIIGDGIYLLDGVRFGPAGLNADNKTTFKAANGARPILTTPTGGPPGFDVQKNYVRIEGLWAGGIYAPGTNIFIGGGSAGLGWGKELVNNTFFGYEELGQGTSEWNLYQGNRFIHYGGGTYQHGIYLSGGYLPNPLAQHAIVDNNIFIGGGHGGYSIHGWHNWCSSVITRNFISGSNWGIVVDGSDHLVANNMVWRLVGAIGAYLRGNKVVFVNNILANGIRFANPRGVDGVIDTNAFLGETTEALGDNIISVGEADITQALGVSATVLDATIASLETAFADTVVSIYANEDIEGLFDILKLTIPTDSPLYQTGIDWTGEGNINIGPDIIAPNTATRMWAAFNDLGLCDWDDEGNFVCPEQRIIF